MPKITSFKLGPERPGKTKKDGSPGKPLSGVALTNDDGEKIVDRQLDVEFPAINEAVKSLKAGTASKELQSLSAGYFRKGADVDFQAPVRAMLCSTDPIFLDEQIREFAKNAKLTDVGTRAFDVEKWVSKNAQHTAKLTDAQLAEMGLKRVEPKKASNQ